MKGSIHGYSLLIGFYLPILMVFIELSFPTFVTATPSPSVSASASSTSSPSSSASTSGTASVTSSATASTLTMEPFLLVASFSATPTGTLISVVLLSSTSSPSSSSSSSLRFTPSASGSLSSFPTLTGTSSVIPIPLPLRFPSASLSRRSTISSSRTRTPLPSSSSVRSTSTVRSTLTGFDWSKLHYISGEFILQNITLTSEQFLDNQYWLIGQRFRTILAKYLRIPSTSVFIIAVHDIVNTTIGQNKVITEYHPINLYTDDTDNLPISAFPRRLPSIYSSFDIVSLFQQPKLRRTVPPVPLSRPSPFTGSTYPRKGIGICFRIVTSNQGSHSNDNNIFLSQYYLYQLTNLFNSSVLSLPYNTSDSFFYSWLHPFSLWLWNTDDEGSLLDSNSSNLHDLEYSTTNNNYDLYIFLVSQSLMIHEPTTILGTDPDPSSSSSSSSSLVMITLVSVSGGLGFLMVIGIIIIRNHRYRLSFGTGIVPINHHHRNNVSTFRIDYGGLWSPTTTTTTLSTHATNSIPTATKATIPTGQQRRRRFLAESMRKINPFTNESVKSMTTTTTTGKIEPVSEEPDGTVEESSTANNDRTNSSMNDNEANLHSSPTVHSDSIVESPEDEQEDSLPTASYSLTGNSVRTGTSVRLDTPGEKNYDNRFIHTLPMETMEESVADVSFRTHTSDYGNGIDGLSMIEERTYESNSIVEAVSSKST